MPIVSELITEFKNSGIDSARTNAEAILSSILGCRAVDLYTEDILLNPPQKKRLEDMVIRRINGEPLQYITGRVNFYGNELFIEPGVFIPRPETEVLVDSVINLAIPRQARVPSPRDPERMRGASYPSASSGPLVERLGARSHKLQLLDVGTGSGNIAISLTKMLTPLEIPPKQKDATKFLTGLTDCKIIGSDISDKAVALAKRNASINGVSDRIEFIKADLFDIPKIYKGNFDIIVSNPPYIAYDILGDLPAEVRYEPQEALDGGRGGISFYLRIIEESPHFLKNKGFLALELAGGACEKVKGLFMRSRWFNNIRVFKDLNGIERVITAQKL